MAEWPAKGRFEMSRCRGTRNEPEVSVNGHTVGSPAMTSNAYLKLLRAHEQVQTGGMAVGDVHGYACQVRTLEW